MHVYPTRPLHFKNTKRPAPHTLNLDSFLFQDLTAAADVFKRPAKNLFEDPIAQMEACPVPIIGAINGPAFTAGFEIALACDILVASPEATFADTHCT